MTVDKLIAFYLHLSNLFKLLSYNRLACLKKLFGFLCDIVIKATSSLIIAVTRIR